MRNDEEETLAALQTLFTMVSELGQMDIRDLFAPGKHAHYKETLAAAYDALVKVEDALDGIGMRLEYQHWRISSAFEELSPLFIQPQTHADVALEAFAQDMERFEQRLQQP